MDLFSFDSVILVIVNCNCLPFSYSRSIFRRHTFLMISTENNVSEPPNLNFLGDDTPIPPHKPRAFCSFDNAPRYKKPSYGPVIMWSCVNHWHLLRLDPSQIVPWRDQQFGKNIYRIFGHHHIFKEMSFSTDYEIPNKLLITIQIQYLCLTTRLLRLSQPPPSCHITLCKSTNSLTKTKVCICSVAVQLSLQVLVLAVYFYSLSIKVNGVVVIFLQVRFITFSLVNFCYSWQRSRLKCR